jgi:choline-sulfatase
MPYRIRRPNILFVMADQHRFDWLGCAGMDQVATPNLDRLAASGVRFAQATCNSPLCAPARAALATGVRPERCHVLDNGYNLDPDAWTVYRHLRRYGYRTALFGKLDLHKPQNYNGVRGDLPITYQLGFTHPFEAEGKQHGAGEVRVQREDGSIERLLLGPYQQHLAAKGLLNAFTEDYRYRATVHEHYAEPSVLPCEDFEDAWIGDTACDYLRDLPQDAPWFTFVSFVGPHNPWDAPREYLDKYADVEMPAPIADVQAGKPDWVQDKQESMSRGTTPQTAQKMRQNYSGMVTLIDDYVGEMLEIIEARGELADTLVIYTSDHGEMLGDMGLVHKSVHYESALRVPMILSGHGVPAAGESDALVELFDLTPTLLELVGLPVPTGLDARSLVPLMQGETKQVHDLQITQLPPITSVRGERYKAISNPNDQPELYDLQEDPCELENIYDAHPDIYDDMMARARHQVRGGMVLNG